MDEVPISITPYYDHYFNNVKKLPKTPHLFITVKDNGQNSKWVTIGKVSDWIRKYASKYIITRGLSDGIHFHIIAYCDKGTPKFVKGIHFRISQIGGKKTTNYDPEDMDGILRSKYLFDKKKHTVEERIKVPPECLKIASMITAHWLKLRNREVRETRQNAYSEHIKRVLNYLQKNLEENPREQQIQYLAWIQKC